MADCSRKMDKEDLNIFAELQEMEEELKEFTADGKPIALIACLWSIKWNGRGRTFTGHIRHF